ncbi:leucine-rich repeat protein [Parabacteroides provencensis]|uniref:leucine-rich repeat protein n=1 Tax=Parabacteroides provencensis TaxID=1944636 RepID=UPI000C1585A1|nr:leucine-rich repeat protein [Parabacteroides provencensis]
MKIKVEISQEELSATVAYTETRPYILKLEFRTQDMPIQEFVPDPPSSGGVIDALLQQGRFDNSWLQRVLQESIVTCEKITDYTNCRDISSHFIPAFQDKVIPNMSNRFRGNPFLLSLPTLDWSSVEDVSAICFNNKGMVEIDMPSSHNIKIWRQAFYGCNSIQRIHRQDLSGAIMLVDIFNGCSSLQILPELNTTKATQFTNFINGCTALERIEGIDFSSSQTEINIGQNLYTKLNSLTIIRVNGTISQNITLYADNLAETSVISIMTALVASPLQPRTVTLTKALANKISEATKQIASDKGWSLLTV